MKMLVQATVLLFAAALVGGCQKVVTSRLPSGTDGYAAIAVPAETYTPPVYTLRSGDRLSVQVFRENEFSAEKVLVDYSGNVSLPLIGSVHAAGLTQEALAEEVRTILAARFLRDPKVSVMVEQPALATVSVEGEVDQPGVYEIAPGSTLLTAVAMARSPTETAKLDEVLIFRTVDGQRVGGRFDLAEIRAGAAPDPRLVPGDVVVVGFSRVRSAFQDFLKTAPLLNIFAYY